MVKSFEGLWEFDILNGAPDSGSNQFTLVGGEILETKTGERTGTYQVYQNELVLMIAMSAVPGETAWSVRASLPFDGPLAGEYMLGEAEAIFSEDAAIPITKCSFRRLRDDP